MKSVGANNDGTDNNHNQCNDNPGGGCGGFGDCGDVFIETRLNNPNEMKLFYSQDKDGLITSPSQCPNFDTFVPLLPTEVMILTKLQ